QQKGIGAATGADALSQIKQALSAIRTMYITSLEGLREQGFEPAADIEEPGIGIDTAKLAARLREAIEALPEKERALIKMHYWEGKNLLEAGAELGISKSWASRLHGQVVDRLRAVIDSG
ncbi:MAG: sigma factor-like helix-turn-helix DNA-binding protein, partial [Kofleriaceae bacterium]